MGLRVMPYRYGVRFAEHIFASVGDGVVGKIIVSKSNGCHMCQERSLEGRMNGCTAAIRTHILCTSVNLSNLVRLTHASKRLTSCSEIVFTNPVFAIPSCKIVLAFQEVLLVKKFSGASKAPAWNSASPCVPVAFSITAPY